MLHRILGFMSRYDICWKKSQATNFHKSNKVEIQNGFFLNENFRTKIEE